MRAGQVKTMINDNLQVPLSLAPFADAEGAKYYPVMGNAIGAQIWTIGTNFTLDHITSNKNTVFYASRDNNRFHAHEALTGDLLWKSDIIPTLYTTSGNKCFCANENTLVYGNQATSIIYGIDALTGKLKWSNPATSFSYTVGNQTTAFVGSTGTKDIFAYNMDSGNLVWKKTLTNALSYVNASKTIFAGIDQTTKKVMVYDALTGTFLWSVAYVNLSASAICTNEKKLFNIDPTTYQLYAYDALTGVLLWSKGTGAYLNYITADEKRLYARYGADNQFKLRYYDAVSGDTIYSKTGSSDLRFFTLCGDIVCSADMTNSGIVAQNVDENARIITIYKKVEV